MKLTRGSKLFMEDLALEVDGPEESFILEEVGLGLGGNPVVVGLGVGGMSILINPWEERTSVLEGTSRWRFWRLLG